MAEARAVDPVARFVAEIAALERAYSLGHHGRWAAERRAGSLDGCLAALFEAAGAPAGAALAALGGYGRRRQLPFSDVDVLLLHEGLGPDEIEQLARAVLYPLWDAGLAVGQAVRTAAECADAAAARLDAWTAMLDARLVAGDIDLLERALAPVRAAAAEDPESFVADLGDAAAARRERFGSATHMLEPDLKESSGALRDVASLGWLEAALGSLDDAGLLRRRERDAVDQAEEFLIRVRSTMHLQAGKRADRLVLDSQPDVAAAMGFIDEPGLPAVDGLMRALFEHARQVEHVVHAVLERAASDAGPARALDSPEAVLEALAEAAEGEAPPSANLLDAIEDANIPESVVWTPAGLAAFLRILRSGSAGMQTLEALDRLDLLARFLPAWADVRCRPQRDPYHRFTVDGHLTATVAAAASLLQEASETRADTPDDEVSEAVEAPFVDRIVDRDALLLGALFHDVGKVGRGDHVPIGADIALSSMEGMGVPRATRDLATFLVAEHLLIPDTATRRDLTDENLILDVAARVGTVDRLSTLCVLTVADAVATGPVAWTPWRAALVRELVTKVRHVLERGDMGEELAVRLVQRTDRLREMLTNEPDAVVDRFVLRMPRAYFLAVEPDRAARHFATIAPELGANEVRTTSAPGSRPATYEVLVVATDRPGLLSWIAGALTLGGISILSAQVFTTDDGVAADLFEVEGAFEPEIGEHRWREFRSMLRRAIDGSVSLERRVDDKRRRYPAPRTPTPVTVHVDNDASDFSSVVEVGAPDRVGLLFDVTRTFVDLRVDVHFAKVSTLGGRVVDAFYVRDPFGRKITDATQLEELRSALTAALA